jgi:hypothetical protein
MAMLIVGSVVVGILVLMVVLGGVVTGGVLSHKGERRDTELRERQREARKDRDEHGPGPLGGEPVPV